MRLTLRTNLAARVLMFCAVNQGRIVRTQDIADHCNASLNHLLQVVALLQGAGFVETLRGRSGGLRLALPAAKISIGHVFRLFEGDLPLAECFDPARNTCPLRGPCRLQAALCRAQAAFFHELDAVSLQDLVAENHGLAGLLRLSDPAPGLTAPPTL